MKRLVSLLLVFGICVSLCACTRQNLEEIQEKMIGDQFVYAEPLKTYLYYEDYGIELKSAHSGSLEFYEDGTFFLVNIDRWREYKDGTISQSEYENRDETEKLYGTFELSYSAEDPQKIVVILNVTKRIYEEYDGTTKNVDEDEQYSAVKEFTIYIADGLIQSIGIYESLNYVGQQVINTALN